MGRNKDCIWKVEEKAKKNRENDCGKQEAQNKTGMLSPIEGRTRVGPASEKWPHSKDTRVKRLGSENSGETKKRKKHRK